MKNLISKENLLYIGIGIATSYLIYNILINREKIKEKKMNESNKSNFESDDSSDFCGCGM
jgi:hypothetical protein